MLCFHAMKVGWDYKNGNCILGASLLCRIEGGPQVYLQFSKNIFHPTHTITNCRSLSGREMMYHVLSGKEVHF